MPTAHQLDPLARRERCVLIRNWCYWIGLLISGFGISAIGGMAVTNPKNWSSAYHALAQAGALRWLVFPLLGLGAALLITALVLTVVLSIKR
jgi:hypothetical protein